MKMNNQICFSVSIQYLFFCFLGLSYIFFSFFVKTTFYTLTLIRFSNCLLTKAMALLLTLITVQTPTKKKCTADVHLLRSNYKGTVNEVLIYVLLSSLVYCLTINKLVIIDRLAVHLYSP